MKCFHHPEKDAVATCAQCNVGLCKECEETSEFRIDNKALCNRCNASEAAGAIAEHARCKRRIIWFSILFVPGLCIFSVGALDKNLVVGIVGCLLIWGISGLGATLKDTFFPPPQSVKGQVKGALLEHEYPIASLIGKIIGFFVQLMFSYALYAVALPFKLGWTIFVFGNNKVKIKELRERYGIST
ncbi:MAG: hypothetical protein LBT94_01990 [Prevotellaceae bacterium]|jgi:hypothetical protein|nr:hypothetical protein [Prevotellaceae bacterium]